LAFTFFQADGGLTTVCPHEIVFYGHNGKIRTDTVSGISGYLTIISLNWKFVAISSILLDWNIILTFSETEDRDVDGGGEGWVVVREKEDDDNGKEGGN
jgi:hypothetical protein